MQRAMMYGCGGFVRRLDIMRGPLWKRLTGGVVMVGVILMAVSASAHSFSGLVVFGDSLVDPGNLFVLTDETFPPSPPYDTGRFSNGPVWVEFLAGSLGFGPDAILNLAFGGATTGTANINAAIAPDAPGLLPQIDLFAELLALADSVDLERLMTALYVVSAGGNDLLAAGGDPAAAITTAVTNIATAVGTLATLGAHTILVSNLPDLGKLPEVQATGDAAFIGGATLLSVAFNDALATALNDVEMSLGIDLILLDTFALLEAISADPTTFGLSNVTDRCLSADHTAICDTPAQFLFWDGRHPTTVGHSILAEAAFAAIAPPLTVALGDQSPVAPLRVDTTNGNNLPVLQVGLDTGPEMASITGVTLQFTHQSGNAAALVAMRVRLVHDVNGNGQFDAGETVLSTRDVNGMVDALTLDLAPPLDILPSLTPQTTDLLVTLDIILVGSGVANTSLASMIPGPLTPLGWWVMLPSVVGLGFLQRLRQRAPQLSIGLLLLMLCCSVVLTSCTGDGDESFTFTPTIPAQGITAQGATSGQLTGPATPIVGVQITVSP